MKTKNMKTKSKKEWKRVMYSKPTLIHNDVAYSFNSLQFQVSEHIEPDETDHLSSRDDDDGDAYSSAADSDAGQYEERMEESDVY